MIMLWHIYLRKGTVFIPTVARTDAGFYMDIDPVEIVESGNRSRIVDAIKSSIVKGNPIVETPTRAAFPKPVVLKYTNVKSWGTFEKNAFCWTIKKNGTVLELHSPHMDSFRGWDADPAKIETFKGESAIDEMANSVADQVQGGIKM
jgi:hypothetical protein